RSVARWRTYSASKPRYRVAMHAKPLSDRLAADAKTRLEVIENPPKLIRFESLAAKNFPKLRRRGQVADFWPDQLGHFRQCRRQPEQNPQPIGRRRWNRAATVAQVAIVLVSIAPPVGQLRLHDADLIQVASNNRQVVGL